jgi:hypothetical protein
VQGTTLPYQSIPPFVTQDAGHVELDLGAGVHGGFWLRGARLEELDRELEPEEQSGERSEESRPPQHPSQGFWSGNGHFSFTVCVWSGGRSPFRKRELHRMGSERDTYLVFIGFRSNGYESNTPDAMVLAAVITVYGTDRPIKNVEIAD